MEEHEQDTFDAVVAAIDALEPEPDRHIAIQIDESLREAIRASQSNRKGATVTITVKVAPDSERRMRFSATVAAKIPKPSVAGITLFTDANGNVHKSDPAQARMDFYNAATTRKHES